MPDNFQSFKATKEQPADKALPVTYTSGSFTPAEAGRGLYVGGSGNVVVRLVGEPSTSRTFSGVVAGSVLPIRVSSIIESGTTATNLLILV